ncbi:uncharacterized protein LOC119293610 [Triticum dicoccoides]|uniref:uncharacterized protein LOC119293610 n=1 Tax=Triticum dicoccoides TaxID=85692 RepID=UPI00188E6BE2|nr:uncharacterized protein LOC119293610 [Triticum dicoccoides]
MPSGARRHTARRAVSPVASSPRVLLHLPVLDEPLCRGFLLLLLSDSWTFTCSAFIMSICNPIVGLVNAQDTAAPRPFTVGTIVRSPPTPKAVHGRNDEIWPSSPTTAHSHRSSFK